MRLGFALVLTLAAAACRSSHAGHVELQGEPASMAALSGDWDGTYWSGSPARRGKLKLFIGAGVESEYGDVVLTTPLGEHPIAADEGPAHRAHTRLAQSLRIDLARVVDGRLTGVLEPYVAPDCGCVVTTTFNGAIAGDTIRGTFARRGSGGDADGGWMAVRTAGRGR